MTSLQGCWLIAAQSMQDPNFRQTCILIVRHDDDGAMGLVLNRPTKVTVAEAWEQVGDGTCAVDGMLLQGGPCEGPLMAVHRPGEFGIDGQPVTDGTAWSVESHSLTKLIEGGTDAAKFVVGYSGWAPAQLEAELAEGSWLVTRAARDEIFSHHDGLWNRLIRKVGREQVLANVPRKIIPPDANSN